MMEGQLPLTGLAQHTPQVCSNNPAHFEFGFMSVAAHRKVSAPGFSFFRAERVNGGFVLTGAVQSTISRGPNKGNAKWSGKKLRMFISDTEMRTEEALYEAETGRCFRCVGAGKTARSWSSITGTQYRTCERCSGNGAAPKEDAS